MTACLILTVTTPAARPVARAAHAGTANRFPVADRANSSASPTRVLAQRARGGATAAETDVSQAVGQSVTVRKGEVETIAYNRDKGIGVTVYLGQRRGHASTADFSDDADARHRRARRSPSRATRRRTRARDSPIPARLAPRDPDLDLYDPWELAVDEAIDARRAKPRPRRSPSIARITNTEGATVAWNESEFVYANSQRLCRRLPQLAPSHRLRGHRRGRRRDAARLLVHGGARGRRPAAARREVGRIAGERTVRRLSARKLGTLECPVLFEAPEAADLHRLVRAARCPAARCIASRRSCSIRSARRCSRRTCRFARSRTSPRARGSAPFDNEGVATAPRDVVRDGVVHGYFLGSYSARKLGMATTGNAGGSHNLVVAHGDDDLPALLRRMGRGLFVTEQLGQGVNPVTGDYSRGAAGFWIEDGVIAYPVEEITIAGNLKSMFRDIVAIGSDVDRRGSRHTGSILIGRMTIAGS